MPAKEKRCVFSIPPGVGFLETLVEALFEGRLVSGFRHTGDPLTLADVTIYLPTRRAARALRDVLLRKLDGQSAILPVIRPLGEFDEEAALFDTEGATALDLAPPIEALDRILLLAPLVQAWKARLPGHVAALFEEGVVVPASASDSIWLARDLAGLMDEIETEEADWTKLASLAPDALAHWWQVTLEFLQIVTAHWPKLLEELDRSNPAAHRNAMLAAEAARLKAHAHKARSSPPVPPAPFRRQRGFWRQSPGWKTVPWFYRASTRGSTHVPGRRSAMRTSRPPSAIRRQG